MNYYLRRYDLPLVLGYTGPGLFSYSPGYGETSDLVPSFSKTGRPFDKGRELGESDFKK